MRRYPIVIAMGLIIYLIIITIPGICANNENANPNIFIDNCSLPSQGLLTFENYTLGNQSIIIHNISLRISRENLSLEKIWLKLPISSAMLNNTTIQLDSNFSLQNCSILLPELNTTIVGNFNITPNVSKNISIKSLNNKTLDVTGMYLRVPKTSALLQSIMQISDTELNVPESLYLKNINLTFENKTNKTNISMVSGSLSLDRSYVFFIRNTTLELPPGSVIHDKSQFQQWNYTVTKWNIKYIIPSWSFSNFAVSIFSLLIRVIGLLFAVWLLYILLYRFIGLAYHKPRSLVIKDFTKTGYKDIDDNLEALSQLAREKLGLELERLATVIEKHTKEQELSPHVMREFKPLPNNLKKKDLADLCSSLKNLNTNNSFPFLSFIDLSALSNILFPSKGLEVSCFPQRMGKDPEMLGITFKLADLSEKQEPRSYTYWEKLPDPTKKFSDADISQVTSLIRILADAGEFQEAKKYQRELLNLYERQAIISIEDQLRKFNEKILNLEIGSRLFALGDEFRKIGNIDEAIKHYLKALNEACNECRNIEGNIKSLWERILTDPKNEEYIEDIMYIGRIYWKAGLQNEAAEELSKAEKRYPKNIASKALSELNMIRRSKADLLYSAAKKLKNLSRPKDAKDVVKKALELSPDYKDALDLSRELDTIVKSEIKEKVTQERYVELLEPATIWLASEISRFWMLDYLQWERYHFWNSWQTLPYISKIINIPQKESAVHNFFGALYTSRGIKDHKWFDLAENDLKKASKLYEDWYLPHENLGFLYSIKGQKKEEKEKKELESLAIVEYQKALTESDEIGETIKKARKTSDMNGAAKGVVIGAAIGTAIGAAFGGLIIWIAGGLIVGAILGMVVMRLIKGSVEDNSRIIKARINIGMDLAYHYMDKSEKANKFSICKNLNHEVCNKHCCIPDPNKECRIIDFIKYTINSCKSSRLIYNLACLYALRGRINNKEKENNIIISRLLLSISLAMDVDKNLWNFVQSDSDLDEVRGNLSDLKFPLSYELAKYKNPRLEDVDTLVSIFCAAFKESGWLDKQHSP